MKMGCSIWSSSNLEKEMISESLTLIKDAHLEKFD